MSDPQTDTVISLLQEIAAGQVETNTLLRRIVPDAFDFNGGLYEMIRRGLYRVTVQGENPPSFTPLPTLLDESLNALSQGVSVNAGIDEVRALLQSLGSAVGLLSLTAQDQYQFLFTQLDQGAATLTLAETLRAIRDNTEAQLALDYTTFLQGIDSTLLALLNSNRTLVTTPTGPQPFTLTELIYALGVCSCDNFLGGDPPPPDVPSFEFAACAQYQEAQVEYVKFGPTEFLGQTTFAFETLEAYVYTAPPAQVYSTLGKSIVKNPILGDPAFAVLRDDSLSGWVVQGQVVFWDGPVETRPRYILGVGWPYEGSQVPSTPGLQAALAGRLAEGEPPCIVDVPVYSVQTFDPDAIGEYYAIVALWPPGEYPAGTDDNMWLAVAGLPGF